jgi:hypothetical protein
LQARATTSSKSLNSLVITLAADVANALDASEVFDEADAPEVFDEADALCRCF